MVEWLTEVPTLRQKLRKIHRRYNKAIYRSLWIIGVLFVVALVYEWRSATEPIPNKHRSTTTTTAYLSIEIREKINALLSTIAYNTTEPFSYQTYLAYLTSHNTQQTQLASLLALTNASLIQSSHRCVGKQNLLSAHDRRACRFKNVCYNKPTSEWTYHQLTPKPVFTDNRMGPQFSFGKDFIAMAALWFFPTYFTPLVTTGIFPVEDGSDGKGGMVMLPGMSVAWTTNLQDFNMGHFVFEELGSIHYTLARLGITSTDARVIYLKQDPNNKLFSKFIAGFLPAITSTPLNYLHLLVASYSQENVCFEELVVGGYSRMFYGFLDDFNEGKEPLLQAYRSSILASHGFPTNSLEPTPTRHKILINIKSDSVYLRKQGRNRFRVIANADTLFTHLKNRYPHIEIIQQNLSKLSIKDQIALMQTITIFISHPGGSCMALPFISHNSHALLMDYYATEKDGMFGYMEGDSVSMEVSFWNLWTHFEKVYYTIFGKGEMEWDSQALKDADSGEDRERGNGVKGGWMRDDASVVVDLQRVEFLINEMITTHEF